VSTSTKYYSNYVRGVHTTCYVQKTAPEVAASLTFVLGTLSPADDDDDDADDEHHEDGADDDCDDDDQVVVVELTPPATNVTCRPRGRQVSIAARENYVEEEKMHGLVNTLVSSTNILKAVYI
jgi:hypothetical protein